MILALVVMEAHAIDREQALDQAAAYAAHEWYATEENEQAYCSEDYESDYAAGGPYRGLPYDWGGHVTIAEFDADLAEGQGAGSHSWHGVLSCTTGLDCSGFVSKVWDSGHYSTSTFSSVATDIDASELLRADAVNDAGSHMVLYTHETNAGQPIFYEATSGSINKVRVNVTGGWAYLNGYQPIRYDNIEAGASTGTKGEPKQIDAFPYEDVRWTAGSASDEIDRYSCAPDTDESGPEVLYQFEAATSGTLTVVVSDDAAVDVDVHVLTEPNGESCLARDDSEVELVVGPGTVWIAVDTYVSGSEFPGPYVLTASFSGDLGEIPEDTDLGDTEDSPIEGGLRNRTSIGERCGCATDGSLLSLAPVLLAAAWQRRRRSRSA